MNVSNIRNQWIKSFAILKFGIFSLLCLLLRDSHLNGKFYYLFKHILYSD